MFINVCTGTKRHQITFYVLQTRKTRRKEPQLNHTLGLAIEINQIVF